MAQRRMLDKKISTSLKVAKLDYLGMVLYTWMIPHADDLGFLQGEPMHIKGLVAPLLDITSGDVEERLKKMIALDLIKKVSLNDKNYYYIVNFYKSQTLRKDRQPQLEIEFDFDQDPQKSWEKAELLLQNLIFGSHSLPNGSHRLAEVKGREENIREDKIKNNDKNSVEFSELEKSDLKKAAGIPEEKNKHISHEFQDQALKIIQALSVPASRKSAYFKAVKDIPRGIILEAYSFAADHPTPEARDKMFFWKINDIRKGKNGQANQNA